MAGGLVGLLDDIASLAKLAATSIDDVGLAASKASAKAAGVVIDDTAVTPAYVHGLAADRELPIIKRIARGSLKNKLLFILPVALVLSEFVPTLVEVILMCGGTYLCYEGAHKIHHKLTAHEHADEHALPAAAQGVDQEEATIASAIRTDFILSGEIMVIALKEVLDEGFAMRAAILVIVAALITAAVYGVVALIVKMDDIGLRLVETKRAERLGRVLVQGMPKVLAVLSVVGTAAMVWVGGHILLVGTDELGWHWPYEQVHHLEESAHGVAGVGGVLGWLLNTAVSAVIGLAVGFVAVTVVARIARRRRGVAAAETAAH